MGLEAKQILRDALDAGKALKDLERQRAHYEQMIMGTGVKLGGMPIAHDNHSKIEEIAIHLADITADIEREAVVYTNQIIRARQLISQVPMYRHRQVLTLRYLCMMDWTDIQTEMKYSGEKSVFKIHGWALQAAQRVLDTNGYQRGID